MMRLWVVVAVLITGCGSKSRPVELRDKRVIGEVETDDLLSDRFFLEDEDCVEGSDPFTMKSVLARYLDFGNFKEFRVLNPGMLSQESFEAPGIASAGYGMKLERQCVDPSDNSTCQDKKIVKAATPLRICRVDGTYDRKSIEGIALSSAVQITRAFQFYQSIPGHRENLAKIFLNVLPLDVDLTSDGSQKSIKTDNLSYFRNFSGKPSIAILPKSAAAVRANKWNGYYLWEVPWAIIHEYGHHVMYSYGSDDVERSLTVPSTLSTESSGRRIVRESDIVDAVAEGYADLFAHLATGAKAGLLKGVDCVATRRDVTSKYFANGELKVLSREVIQRFFSVSPAGGSTVQQSCEIPRYQEPHTLGAIIAYTVHELLDHSAKATSLDDAGRITYKASKLLIWAEEINRVRTNQNELITFQALLKPIIRAIKDDGHLAPTSFCSKVGELFAGIKGGLDLDEVCPEFKP